VSFSILTITMR